MHKLRLFSVDNVSVYTRLTDQIRQKSLAVVIGIRYKTSDTVRYPLVSVLRSIPDGTFNHITADNDYNRIGASQQFCFQ